MTPSVRNRIFLLVAFVFSLFSFTIKGQDFRATSFQQSDIASEYKHLSLQQLLDTANHYFDINNHIRALACYDLIIKAPIKTTNLQQIQKLVEALDRSATIYRRTSDYRSAHDFLLEALHLCETLNLASHRPAILLNIGNIYYYFDKFDEARFYYSEVVHLFQDSVNIVRVLNNLGAAELGLGNLDEAFYLLNQALQISGRHNDAFLHNIKSNFAMFHKKRQDYDSAFYYYWISLDEARKNNRPEKETMFLSYLGELFFETGQTDSALLYIDLSKRMAIEHNFLKTLAENYLILSRIEKSRGHHRKALEYFEKHANLRDSIFGSAVLGNINQLQRSYELSRVNRQIDQLVVEQQIKENIIRYQKVIQYIIFAVLILMSMVLVFIFFQNRKLNLAYKVLFEKNVELLAFQENSQEKKSAKKHTKKSRALTQNMQDELLDKILMLMEDTSIVCDPEFSIDKLAELSKSNQKYVSQVINDTLKKNFRTFLGTYRIQEAQRLLADFDATKYTIDSIALKVGYKSPNSFRDAFKEITGVSPSFYLKSIQDKSNS